MLIVLFFLDDMMPRGFSGSEFSLLLALTRYCFKRKKIQYCKAWHGVLVLVGRRFCSWQALAILNDLLHGKSYRRRKEY